MCISYSSCWHKEYISWLSLPEFGTLIQPDDFLKDIQTYDYIRAAYELQKSVMGIVNLHDTSFSENMTSERWYQDFWKSFSGRSNIFNLNYDNTIENSLGEYEDGFPPIKDGEEYSRFSAKNYYENKRGVSTIAHLHGQILFTKLARSRLIIAFETWYRTEIIKRLVKIGWVDSKIHLIRQKKNMCSHILYQVRGKQKKWHLHPIMCICRT